ncbi:hypothetical protein LWC33_24065 [Pseudonocardia sp. RS11V-5]|uniref:hypothetical protein n=1 Tax=Pseudonocardia terrae TaxID=2905831 RepID=UPI001E3DCF6A|nr:hypothetical protein [Pseudonocardia terrae]MCE3554521.1 hypothetical protein [Pseudonocardia terrae]
MAAVLIAGVGVAAALGSGSSTTACAQRADELLDDGLPTAVVNPVLRSEGCGSWLDQQTASGQPAPVTPAQPAFTPSGPQSADAKWGERYTFINGVVFALSNPRVVPVEQELWAQTGPDEKVIAVDLRVDNPRSSRFDPDTVTCRASLDGTNVRDVFSLDFRPMAWHDIVQGGSMSWTVGFAVPRTTGYLEVGCAYYGGQPAWWGGSL